MTARSITDSILNCEIAASLAFLFRLLHVCKDNRASCIHLTCSSCSIKVLHLPFACPNSVTKTHIDGNTSPLQIIMHLLIRLERFENFFYGRTITFLLASLTILLMCVHAHSQMASRNKQSNVHPHLHVHTSKVSRQFASSLCFG